MQTHVAPNADLDLALSEIEAPALASREEQMGELHVELPADLGELPPLDPSMELLDRELTLAEAAAGADGVVHVGGDLTSEEMRFVEEDWRELKEICELTRGGSLRSNVGVFG